VFSSRPIPWSRELNITELPQICDNFLELCKIKVEQITFFGGNGKFLELLSNWWLL
jgi:hypothetical protein